MRCSVDLGDAIRHQLDLKLRSVEYQFDSEFTSVGLNQLT